MAKETLRLKDGFDSNSPELRDEVKKLQSFLDKAGFDVDADGLFGKGTEEALKAFQRQQGLVADGIAGPATWVAIEEWENDVEEKPEEEAKKLEKADVSAILEGFRGDLSWVHAREGHAGKTYWPGGASGVTLDPGVDLGHAKPSLIEAAYKPLLSADQFNAVKKVLGLKKWSAKKALGNDPVLKSIRISRSQADSIMKYAAQPYWKAITRRFPTLMASDTPGSVQTVMLSLSYNRGAGNRNLRVLTDPIEKKDWAKVADIVGSMQQDHKLRGIRERRRMEGELIRESLKKK